jgi:hypothetical protein
VAATSGKILPTITGGVVETTPQSIDGDAITSTDEQGAGRLFGLDESMDDRDRLWRWSGFDAHVFVVGFAIYRRRHRNT